VTADETHTRFDDGWWPYVIPYFGFLLVVELSAYFPAVLAFPALFLKPAVPAALLLFFFSRGAYPELRAGDFRPPRILADIGIGIASACLWVAPYLIFPSLQPDGDSAFDPQMAGAELAGLVLALRFAGFALVTPVFEELFIRSFVMRYAQALRDQSDFRAVPIGSRSTPGFLATAIVFTITHLPWEYWVAVPWIVLTNLYFYWRRNLWALIVVHGTANATILLFVMSAGSGFWGLVKARSLWFFV
jgi:CAAX prenyl protease-like protein